MVKRAIENNLGTPITILLDRGAPHENVVRFLTNRGFVTDESTVDNSISLLTTPPSVQPDAHSVAARNRVMLITSNQIGDGPVELGQLLMKNFIISLMEQSLLPERMLFLNTAVHLTTEGSEVLAALDALANRGVEIMTCGLCLDYFQKKELLRSGSVTNMFTTAESLLQADTVIKL
jgi:selenium metabolism protein YedF